MPKGIICVEWSGEVFEVAPGYEAMLLSRMLNRAAECYLAKEFEAFKANVLAKELPELPPIPFNSQVDKDLFYVFLGWLPVEAFRLFERVKAADFKPHVQEVMQLLLVLIAERGAALRNQFVERNEPYFRAAIEANRLCPSAAFVAGCESAGLPLDVWAEHWPLQLVEETGYLLPEAWDAAAAANPLAMERASSIIKRWHN